MARLRSVIERSTTRLNAYAVPKFSGAFYVKAQEHLTSGQDWNAGGVRRRPSCSLQASPCNLQGTLRMRREWIKSREGAPALPAAAAGQEEADKEVVLRMRVDVFKPEHGYPTHLDRPDWTSRDGIVWESPASTKIALRMIGFEGGSDDFRLDVAFRQPRPTIVSKPRGAIVPW
jgi:hypothetical protein